MNKQIEDAISATIKAEREQVARYAAEVMRTILLNYMVNPSLTTPVSPEKLLQWGKTELNDFRKRFGMRKLIDNLTAVSDEE